MRGNRRVIVFLPLSLVFRFVVPESPRWLLCKGRTQELKVILESAARMNNIELPQNLDKILKPPNSEKRNKGFLDLFRSKYLRLVSICFLCIWFTMNLVYYGLILNMNALGGNIYVNSVSELEEGATTIRGGGEDDVHLSFVCCR